MIQMVEVEEEVEVMVNYLDFVDYLEFQIIACDMTIFLKNLRDYEISEGVRQPDSKSTRAT